MATQRLAPGRLDVQTRGGQLSKTTQWSVSREGAPVCEIERINWKWQWWTYHATISLGDQTLEATSEISRDALTINVRNSDNGIVATATNRTALRYRDQAFTLTGIESPDAVVDGSGQQYLTLHWRLERLHHIDLVVPASAEFVAIATAVCLLHERPTN